MRPCFEAEHGFTSAASSALYSCSVTYKNTFYIFGGNDKQDQQRQISILSGRRLIRQFSSLKFYFDAGSCANVNDQRVYLCRYRQCHYSEKPSNGESFIKINDTSHDHRSIAMAGSECESIIYK